MPLIDSHRRAVQWNFLAHLGRKHRSCETANHSCIRWGKPRGVRDGRLMLSADFPDRNCGRCQIAKVTLSLVSKTRGEILDVITSTARPEWLSSVSRIKLIQRRRTGPVQIRHD
jgi:hypothetical protein